MKDIKIATLTMLENRVNKGSKVRSYHYTGLQNQVGVDL